VTVRIRLFSTLVGLSKSKQPQFDVDWREGMIVGDVVAAEGFSEQDAEAIAAILNGEQALFERALADGDEVEFIVNLQGGCDCQAGIGPIGVLQRCSPPVVDTPLDRS
jgi:sulfur carrier protein ThiS